MVILTFLHSKYDIKYSLSKKIVSNYKINWIHVGITSTKSKF